MGHKALRFDEHGVKKARRHALLAGKKLLGRGMFSAVYEGSRSDTVYKLSVDDPSYWMLNDPYVAVRHRHFPRLVSSEGEVGETRINGDQFAIRLYEVERLEKIKRGTEVSRLVQQIVTAETSASTTTPRWKSEDYSTEKLRLMSQNATLPRSVRAALRELETFCLNVGNTMVDMHGQNFMARASGELVFTDPIADLRVWNASSMQLHARGF